MTNKTLAYGSFTTLAVSALLGLGCGGGGGGSTPTLASFCDQKADKECGTATKGVAVSCGATVAACKKIRADACVALAATQMSATRPFRAENIGTCLARTSDAYSVSPVTEKARTTMDDACARVFSGLNKGAATDPACTNSYECSPELICDMGICVKKTTSATGFCNDPGVVCGANQYCTVVMAQRKCVPNKMAGEDCDATMPCIDTLRCGAGGKCVEPVAVNLACGVSDDCVTEASYCDPYGATGCKCRAGFTPAPGANECFYFGATDVTGTAQICAPVI